MTPITLILADDHTVVRKGLKALIERLPGMEVIGEANNGEEVLKLLKSREPDAVIMDIGMPVMNGIETTLKIRSEFPTVRVLILSMHETEGYLAQALHAGCHGYVLKD